MIQVAADIHAHILCDEGLQVQRDKQVHLGAALHCQLDLVVVICRPNQAQVQRNVCIRVFFCNVLVNCIGHLAVIVRDVVEGD
ncbi:hypothetical protein SDC9_155784 [bioreactor metagenome]|uniref:Uncharacterized protein n=1 Tax=bioreactor metagenome TaxID=1076179 RepID=A0A645F4R0_9ZZZZ